VIDPELQAMASARRSLMVRIAVVVGMVVLFIGGVVYVAMLISQNGTVERDLHYAAERSSVASPPGCAWLIVDHNGALTSTHGTPLGFPHRDSLASVAGGAGSIEQNIAGDGTTYRVLTERRGDDIVQAVYDLRFQAEDRQDLLIALVVAEVIGLAGAVAAGGLLARRAMAPLGEALRRQRRFVADASHELRTPLTRLRTRAQLLARRIDTAEPERVHGELNRIVDGTRRLSEVIDDLLLSARLRSAPLPFGTVDLAALAAEAVDADSERARQTGLRISLIRHDGPHHVAGVESALRRVVAALVDNAIGHTPPCGRIVLTVGTESGDERTDVVQLSVRDSGVGFDEREAEQLFERFKRGTSGSGQRFGIGLALVREVVDSHDGTIVAESSSEGGAVFTLTLPVAPILPPAEAPVESSPVLIPTQQAKRRLPIQS
jgi:signal transduction histidine kinase